MAKDTEKDRASRLLSKDALPKIEVPRAPPPPPPQFSMPKSVTGPVKAIPTAPPPAAKAPEPRAATTTASPPPPPPPPPAGKEGNRRKRPSTGKFKDRTLGWFAIGDQLAEKGEKEAAEALAAGDQPAEEPTARRSPALAIALGAAAVLTVVVLWLVLR